MNTHADKTQENKNQSVANAVPQKQSGGESTFQFVDNRPEAIAQRKLQEMANNSPRAMQLKAFQNIANISPQVKQAAQLQALADNNPAQNQQPIQKKENNTGLPDNLKTGMENLSGMSLDDVKVHRNSDKPAQLQAHAYAQGTDIHLGPGQEKHLPHEAWHVVQQKQGRVKPTLQMKGKVNVHDDAGLEKEADVMGEKAVSTLHNQVDMGQTPISRMATIQRVGDKMAMAYHDSETPEIQKIREGVERIFNVYKTNKKEARNALDEDVANKTEGLEERQNYLIDAIKMKFYESLAKLSDSGIAGLAGSLTRQTITKEIDKRDVILVDMEIDDHVKLGLLDQAVKIVKDIEGHIKAEMAERVLNSKSANKKSWDSQLYGYAAPFGRHALADPIVQEYEKGYIDSGLNRKKIIADWVEFANSKGYSLMVETESDIGIVNVYNSDDEAMTEHHVATVYFNDQRFEKIKNGSVTINSGPDAGEVREVFKHRGSGKEYVQDSSDMFVKRYVNRALNTYDNPDDKSQGVSIGADPRHKFGDDTEDTWADIATQVPTMDESDQYQEIRNHQRQKEVQKGSPYVSFTTTDRPIFGSSAKFFEGERGAASVDLAKISKSKIFDTHTPEAMERIHGLKEPDPDMDFVEGNEDVERNSAARDAMRTRELVVAGGIPDEAISSVSVSGEDYVKGPSGKFKTQQEALASYMRLLQSPQNLPIIDDID